MPYTPWDIVNFGNLILLFSKSLAFNFSYYVPVLEVFMLRSRYCTFVVSEFKDNLNAHQCLSLSEKMFKYALDIIEYVTLNAQIAYFLRAVREHIQINKHNNNIITFNLNIILVDGISPN